MPRMPSRVSVGTRAHRLLVATTALTTLLATLLTALGAAPPPAGAAPGPAYTVPAAERRAALACAGDPATSQATPVVLVHGTGVTAQENWGATYVPDLRRAGHAVCTVDLPQQSLGDVQRSAEIVAHAVRAVSRRAKGRKISLVGQSQGAFHAFFVVRVWPDLAARLDDVIGLSGVYDAGSAAIRDDCRDGCSPAFHQIAAGSRLLRLLARRPLPAGPDYTTVGTLADATITPQPAANHQPGATQVQIQDVCPGRRSPVPDTDHVLMAGDAVAHALVRDALRHPGPARRTRVPASTCLLPVFAGVDLLGFALSLPTMLTRERPETASEPRVRCFLRPGCTDLRERGRVVRSVDVRRGPRAAVLRLVVQAPGAVRVSVGGRHRVHRVARGTTTVRVPVPPGGAARVRLQGRPDGFARWVTERVLRVPRATANVSMSRISTR